MNTQSTHPDENRLSNFMEGTCKTKRKVAYRLPHGNFKMKKASNLKISLSSKPKRPKGKKRMIKKIFLNTSWRICIS